MERITVVKIGGNVIDNPAALKRFLKEFAALEGPKILIHGGGKLATRLAERLELKVQMVDGRRITDKGTLDVVTMGYAGLINKQVVAGLQAAGCNALGLSGADGNAVTARRRDPEDDTTLIREITAATYPPLKEDGTVSKGMIPKIENALKAIEKGVRSVTIKHSDNLLNDTGTVIK